MSADNGIYILRTLGKDGGIDYRVKHLQAVENVYWDQKTGKETDNHSVWIKNARKLWKGCRVYDTETLALKEAARMLDKFVICEYGIVFIDIKDKIF